MRRESIYLAVVTGAILALFSGSIQGALIVDFDGPSAPFTLSRYGGEPSASLTGGGPTGNFVRLTNDVASQSNTLAFDEVASFTGPQPGGMSMQFDYRMSHEDGHTGCCGQRADGFGVALMATAVYGASGEAPANIGWERPAYPAAFGIGFDIFEEPYDSDIVTLNWDGTQIAEFATAGQRLNTGLFNRVDVLIMPDGANAKVSVTLTEDIHGTPGASQSIFSNFVIPGMNISALPGFRAVFGGRTGAAYVATDIDNINFQSIPEPATVVLFGLSSIVLLRRRRGA